MKKIIYLGLICIIIIGAIITCTLGLNADIMFSKNAELDIYVGETINIQEIKELVKQVFPNERVIVQEIEMFEDMISVTVADRSDEELKTKAEELNTKINEKYGVENAAEDITISHNPKARLSSIIKPYIIPILVSFALILIYAIIRYRKLGIPYVLMTYVLSIAVIEAVLLSIIAITRLPVTRLVIPVGIVAYAIGVTILGFINEKKLKISETNVKKKEEKPKK